MTNPRLLTIPFADTGTKNEIPVSGAIEPQLATFQAGFPVITQQKIADGGIPPERADFNGILNIYGQHIVHLNKGMPYEFDQDFANAIGGYPLHARIMISSGEVVQNTQEGNTNNPNISMGGWKSSAVSKDATIPTYKTAADGVNPVTGVAVGDFFNVRSEDSDTVAIEYQNVGGGAVATGRSYLSALGVQQQEKPASTINDASGKNQQEINNFIGAYWYNKVSGYNAGDRVRGSDELLYESNVDNNTNDPVIDPTNWELKESTGFEFVKLLTGTSTAVINKNTAIMQAAINSGKNLELPFGEFSMKTLKFNESCCGQIIKGQGMYFNGESCFTKINIVDEGGSFSKFEYGGTNFNGGYAMPFLSGIAIKADYPIVWNDPKDSIISNSGSNRPFAMRGSVKNCALQSRIKGVGIGFIGTKLFDSEFGDNLIYDFDIHVALIGCDLNRVENNRFMEGHRYYILELSAGTFGSQNEITHNDMVWFSNAVDRTGGVFIKSTARHARIYDNYLEHVNTRATIKGYIDCSYKDMPVDNFGNINTSGERYTTVCRDNRIDGWTTAHDFIYQYQPHGQVYGEIVDNNTVQPWHEAVPLKLIDSDFNEIPYVPCNYNALNSANFKFNGARFGMWDGFETKKEYSSHITSKNIAVFTGQDASAFFGQFSDVRLTPTSFIILNQPVATPTSNNYLSLSIPTNEAILFAQNRTTTIKVKCRTIAPVSGTPTVETEDFRFGVFAGVSSVASKIVTVTRQWQEFYLSHLNTAHNPTTNTMAAYLKRNSANGNNIEIEYVDVSYQYLDEVRPTARQNLTRELKANIGNITVIAYLTSSKTNPVLYNYRLASNDLYLVSKSIDNAAALDITLTKNTDTNYTFTTTGSSNVSDRYMAFYQTT